MAWACAPEPIQLLEGPLQLRSQVGHVALELGAPRFQVRVFTDQPLRLGVGAFRIRAFVLRAGL